MAEITVTRTAEGILRIAARPHDQPRLGFTQRVLEVAGGVLTWPSLDDLWLPSADIDNPHLAQQWLWAALGDSARRRPPTPGEATESGAPARTGAHHEYALAAGGHPRRQRGG